MFKKVIIIIIAFIIIICSTIVLLKIKENNEQLKIEERDKYTLSDEEVASFSNIELIENRNQFFTVSSSITKYLNYVFSKDAKSIINILDEEYKKEFSVTENNVLEKVENFEYSQIFSMEKAYVIPSSVMQDKEVFAYGTIRDNIMDEITPEKEYMCTVTLDYTNMTYTIKPYGYMFSNNINYNVSNEKVNITSTKYINYMNKCQIYLTVINNTNQTIDMSKNIEIQYFENKQTNKVLEMENNIIKSGEEKQVKLTFLNDVATPCKLIYDNLEIPIITEIVNRK